MKNPDYFIKGRPYLDGIKFVDHPRPLHPDRRAAVRASSTSRAAAGTSTNAEDAKSGAPKLVVLETDSNVNDNVLVNFKKPPFSDRARAARHQPGAGPQGLSGRPAPGRRHVRRGAAAASRAVCGGCRAAEVAKLPGMGDPVKQKAEAKKLLADAGFGPTNPMKFTVSTRALAIYVDTASWMVDQLQQVGHRGDARADRDGCLAPEDDPARVLRWP